ncbi:MAG: DNA ligase D, partial [Candidatus Binataceae bacterium]
PVTYHVFDLLAYANFDLRPLELETRKSLLARVVKNEGPLRYCDHIATYGRSFYHAAAQAGLEGVVAKRRHSPYRGLRGDDWRKIKCPRLGRFVIGGWTDPAGSRAHFGALLAGQYEAGGKLRFVARVGTGFDESKLRHLSTLMNQRVRRDSPFRRPRRGEAAIPRTAHYCEPTLVAEVQFSDWTDDGGVRHPSFKGLVEGADARECVYQGPGAGVAPPSTAAAPEPSPAEPIAPRDGKAAPATNDGAGHSMANAENSHSPRAFTPTNPDKVFWPGEGYTKKDLIDYYELIAPWMLPYLKNRPVVLTRYPDGIEGKSFFQKDAPGFAPGWIRTEKIYSEDSRRDISYFVLESAQALGYIANLGAIPIHIWSSRLPHLERPDWLLFDIDPKGTTTRQAVVVAREVGAVLRDAGMRPYVKSSGQKGIHVMVGLVPEYTYEQARMYAELVAQIVTARIPRAATLIREVSARKGRAYIDYLQLGHGKTIAAPYAARPVAGAPVSAPLNWTELKPSFAPVKYNIKTMPRRMTRLKRDPFLGVLTDLQRFEPSLPKLEAARRLANVHNP